MSNPESWVICNDCKCVMSTHDAKPVDVEYVEEVFSPVWLRFSGTLTTPAMLCAQCYDVLRAAPIQVKQFDNFEDDE